MALEIHALQAPGGGIIADRRLMLTADRARMVEEGDAEASYLLAPPGTEIPNAEVARLGLVVVDGRVVHAEDVAVERPPPPADPPAPSKPAAGGRKRGK